MVCAFTKTRISGPLGPQATRYGASAGLSMQPERKRMKKDSKDVSTGSSNPYAQTFTQFRDEIDAHYDRRERVIQKSRDITALSKKMIFSLHRVQRNQGISAQIRTEIDSRMNEIRQKLEQISPDLSGQNYWRYQRQISPSIQEYVEAMCLESYLEKGSLPTASELAIFESKSGLNLSITPHDYALGVADAGGELMRRSITHLSSLESTSQPLSESTDDQQSNESIQSVCFLLRDLYAGLYSLDLSQSGYSSEMNKKLEILLSCLEKVERSSYQIGVRSIEAST